MSTFLFADQNLPFTVSLALMLAFALLEAGGNLLGLGFSEFLESFIPDFDADMGIDTTGGLPHGPVSSFMGWLRIGEIPAVMLLVIFLTVFGLTGLTLQAAAKAYFSGLMPSALAIIPALIISFPAVRTLGGLMGRFMPKDETDAVSEESFIGRVAFVTLGKAVQGSPAQAKLKHRHGQVHYIMVEPDAPGQTFAQDSGVLLIGRKDAVFTAVPYDEQVSFDDL